MQKLEAIASGESEIATKLANKTLLSHRSALNAVVIRIHVYLTVPTCYLAIYRLILCILEQ